MRDYPTLENFFAAYFHQDWAVEHGSADEVIAYYRSSESPDQVARARAEAQALLDDGLDDAALGARITALGSEYDPTRDGATWRSLLQRIAAAPGAPH